MEGNHKFNIRQSLCLMFAGLISVAEATVAPIPKGIFCMPVQGPNGFPDQILNDPRVVGLDLGDQWPDIEATQGVYDWSTLDTQLAQAEAHGKKVLLGIVSGGLNVPDWLLANYPDIQTFTFIDPNPHHSTYGQPVTIPVFWDPIFLAKKIAFIQAAAARYAAHSSIAVVSCSFANSTTGDWNIPDGPEDIANWQAAGYTTELMVNAGETIIDATMAAFPNQNVVMPIGRNTTGLDPTVDYLSETVVDYATTTYGRFITTRFSLSATTSDPAIETSLDNWQVLFDQCPNVAGQMLWNVSGDNTYRMNGGIPGNKQTILLNAITIGAHYGMQYQEIYLVDLEDSTLSSVIDTANTLLTVTPSPPRAPSSLGGTANGATSLNLTWHDNASNELGYRIESKIGATGTYEVLTTLGPNTTAATITNLIEGTQYYYRLQGVNAGGRSAYSNEKSVTTVLISPGSLSLQALSSSKVRLTWTINLQLKPDLELSEARSQIQILLKLRRSAPIQPLSLIQVLADQPSTTIECELTMRTQHPPIRVKSTLRPFHNIPAAPSGLTITSLLSNKVSLSWSDNSGDESGFKIQRKKGATGTYADIRTTGANINIFPWSIKL